MLSLSQTSLTRLNTVHPDIQKVIRRYLEIGTIPITVLEGIRDIATQKEYVSKGVSQTTRSRHLTGHAIDIAPVVNGQPSFSWPLYYKLAAAIKQAAKDVGITLEWGGDWVSFKDGPHWQLPWKKYPVSFEKAAFVSEETESQSKVKASLAIAATGAPFPLTQVAQALSSQQQELSSGDVTRLAIAGVVLLLTIAGLVWTWRK